MSVEKSPAFQFYARDWLSDERLLMMSRAAKGCYIDLLAMCWLEGSIPADVTLIGAILREPEIDALWPQIEGCFSPHPTIAGRLIQKRMESVREAQRARTGQAATAGAVGGQNRWADQSAPTSPKNPAERPLDTRSKRLAHARSLGVHTPQEWARLVELCENKCARCGKNALENGGRPLFKDHVIPIYTGEGSDAIGNLQPLCTHCSASKGPERKDYVHEEIRAKMRETPSITPSEKPGETPSRSPAEARLNTSPASASASASADTPPPTPPSGGTGGGVGRGEMSDAMKFGRWFFDTGLALGAIEPHLAIAGATEFAYRNLAASQALVAAYPAEELERRSRNLFARKLMVGPDRIGKKATPAFLAEHWAWFETAEPTRRLAIVPPGRPDGAEDYDAILARRAALKAAQPPRVYTDAELALIAEI